MKYIYYLSLGANLGDRLATLNRALEALQKLGNSFKVSHMYETPPWGKLDQPAFINCAATIVTELEPLCFLHGCQEIEAALGRVRHEHWGARTIDIDILCVEQIEEGAVCSDNNARVYYHWISMHTDELNLPHPYMLERAFVMVPLAELVPDLRMDDGQTALAIAAALPDKDDIVKLC